MLLRLPQPPLVGLAVHGHEHLAELAEHADRCGAAADVGLERPSADTVRARTSPSATSPPRLGGAGSAGWSPATSTTPSTTALRAPVRTSAGVGARAEQQPEPGHDHGLAGAGLPGDDVEAGAQLQHGVVDDTEVLDPDLPQHGASLGTGSVSPPRPSPTAACTSRPDRPRSRRYAVRTGVGMPSARGLVAIPRRRAARPRGRRASASRRARGALHAVRSTSDPAHAVLGGHTGVPARRAVAPRHAAPSLDRQVELGHETVGERGGRQPGQAHRRLAARTPRSARPAAARPSRSPSHHMTPDPSVSGSTSTASCELGPDHQRSGEERVGGDGDHQHGLDVGPHDRPARRERVGRGPRGCGHRRCRRSRTSTAAARRSPGQLEHPLAGGLLDAHLVQGPATAHAPRRPWRRVTSRVIRSSTV